MANNADGQVLIEVDLELDKPNVQKEFNEIKKEADRLNSTLDKLGSKRSPLVEQMNQYGLELDEARAKLEALTTEQARLKPMADLDTGTPEQQMDAMARMPGLEQELAAQQKLVDNLQAKFDGVADKVEQYDREIKEANNSLEHARARAGELSASLASTANSGAQASRALSQTAGSGQRTSQALSETAANSQRIAAPLSASAKNGERAAKSGRKMSDAMKRASKSASSFAKRLGSIVSGALVFTVISQALAKMREWFARVAKTNDETVAAMARLKGALLTLVQPILSVVIPAFTTLINILTRVINLAAAALASLFGTNVKQTKAQAEALNEETEALKGVGGAAKDAGKTMASFDEINQLSAPSSGGGGGGGAGADIIPPDFGDSDFSFNGLSEFIEKLKEIPMVASALDLVAAGFNAIKSAVTAILPGVVSFVQIGLAPIAGWIGEKITQVFTFLAGQLTKLGEWFTGNQQIFTQLGTNLGTLTSQVWAFITSLADPVLTIFYNTVDALTTIVLNLGTGLLSVANIILEDLIAAWDGLVVMLQPFTDWLDMVFVSLWEDILSPALTYVGETVIPTVTDTLTNLWENVFVPFGEFLEAQLTPVIEVVSDVLTWLWQHVIVPLANAVGGIFSAAFQTVATLFNEVVVPAFNTVITAATWLWENVLGPIVDFLWEQLKPAFEEVFEGIGTAISTVANAIIAIVEALANAVIDGWNLMKSALNALSFTVPDWVPVLGGKHFGFDFEMTEHISLPRLAEGAVIPPNREFMAVLGDQRSGTNIETPLSTMVQAFRQALAEQGGGGSRPIILMLDRRELGRAVVDVYNMESQRVGLQLGGAAVK